VAELERQPPSGTQTRLGSNARTGTQQPSDTPFLPDPAAQDEEDTSWFDSPAWQAGEAEVDEHLRAGRVTTYDSVDDLLADLHRAAGTHAIPY
jgi:hypothetical protein